jgi:hypothetical protein
MSDFAVLPAPSRSTAHIACLVTTIISLPGSSSRRPFRPQRYSILLPTGRRDARVQVADLLSPFFTVVCPDLRRFARFSLRRTGRPRDPPIDIEHTRKQFTANWNRRTRHSLSKSKDRVASENCTSCGRRWLIVAAMAIKARQNRRPAEYEES